jgi:hypothetical protein
MKDYLKKLNSEELRKFDQKIMEVKSMYDLMDTRHKEDLFQRVEQAAKLNENIPPGFMVSIDVYVPGKDEEGADSRTVSLSPNAIYKAIKAWRNDEPYSPEGCFEIM